MKNATEEIKYIKNKIAIVRGYPNWEEYENWIIDNNSPVVVAQLLMSAMKDVVIEYNKLKNKEQEQRYPSFPKDEDVKTLENIIRQYPKTNDCELQTLAEVRDWQIAELRKLIKGLLKEQRVICSEMKDCDGGEDTQYYRVYVLNAPEPTF